MDQVSVSRIQSHRLPCDNYGVHLPKLISSTAHGPGTQEEGKFRSSNHRRSFPICLKRSVAAVPIMFVGTRNNGRLELSLIHMSCVLFCMVAFSFFYALPARRVP